jgi:two-component system NtrC family sensor kinase
MLRDTVTNRLSIRHKLVVGVTAIFLFMGGDFLTTYYWVSSLQERIGYLETISRFEASVLEMRRFEKNYLLYGDVQSLRTVQYNAACARRLEEEQQTLFRRLSPSGSLDKFHDNLAEYARLIEQLLTDSRGNDAPEVRNGKEAEAIRQLGTEIADYAEHLSSKKRMSINETIQKTIRLELASFILAGIGIAFMGGFMFVKITGPLKLLEESTRRIARGDFEPIENIPLEKEVRDVFESLNRMARDLKRGEDQLVHSKKLASLGTMLAGVAHEINNPLSNISSSCQLLLEELDIPDREFQELSLKTALEQVDKARNIVRTLLEFSRNREFQTERINLKDLVDRTVMLLRGDLSGQIETVTRVDDTIFVDVDAQRFQQALMNLISNAIHAIEGPGIVEIIAENGPDSTVEIAVRDSGRGIPEEDLPHIFDPFFSTRDVGEGTGLGLFVTHDIVTSHMGEIKIDTAPGKGSTVTISIPIKRQRDAKPTAHTNH